MTRIAMGGLIVALLPFFAAGCARETEIEGEGVDVEIERGAGETEVEVERESQAEQDLERLGAEAGRELEQAGDKAGEEARKAGRELAAGAREAGAALAEGARQAGAALEEGAKRVEEEVGPVAREVLSDAAVTAKVKAKLLADPEINPFHIDVDTVDGRVTLNGKVRSNLQREEAEKLAVRTEGVRSVVNLIQVAGEDVPPAPGTR